MKRWRSRTLASLLAASLLLLVWGTPAFATEACNGYTIEPSPNSWQVCIEKINFGYNATARHFAGPTYTVDFNLFTNEGIYGDTGPFSISAGQTKTYFFAVGYKASARVVLFWRSGEPEFAPMESPIVF